MTTRQPRLKPPGLSEELKVTLGGWPQSVFIRGRDRANPVLLYVHGGPGLPEMPVSQVNAELERDFTVVHWDQRGAGKSYSPDFPPATLTIEQLVRDTTALTRVLCARLQQRKIYLVGFSNGSLIGALAAARHPELYHAYVGISQLVNIPESELRLHRRSLAQADAWGYPKVAQRLREIGEPPYHSNADAQLVDRITKQIQPRLPLPLTAAREIHLALQSPYYSLHDLLRLREGAVFSWKTLHDDMWSHDLRREVPEIDVPVYFFLGRYDTTLSAPLGAEFFAQLRAPRGKHLLWFEHSNHALQLEEPARYQAELRRVLAETRGR